MALTLAGLVFQWLHIIPIVKRIWTSSYTLYSGGLVILMLAGFYALIEVQGLEAVGVPAARHRRELDRDLRHELDDRALHLVGAACGTWGRRRLPSSATPFEPVLRGMAVLLVFWGILYWMYRRKIFLKI